jgi:uncharacterized membrane protein
MAPGTRDMIVGTHMADGFGGYGALWMIGLVVLGALIAALVIWLVTRGRSHPVAANPQAPGVPVSPASDTALDIARQRLARGEIDPEQYTAIVTALKS